MINDTHPEKDQFERLYIDGYDPKTKQEASSYLHAVAKFEFIIGLVSLYRLLHPFVGITQNLQGRSIDVVKAFNEVRGCIEDMEHVTENLAAVRNVSKKAYCGPSRPKKCFKANASKQRSC